MFVSELPSFGNWKCFNPTALKEQDLEGSTLFAQAEISCNLLIPHKWLQSDFDN